MNEQIAEAPGAKYGERGLELPCLVGNLCVQLSRSPLNTVWGFLWKLYYVGLTDRLLAMMTNLAFSSSSFLKAGLEVPTL